MEAAAQEFFGIREGSLETIDDNARVRELADKINFVAVGTKGKEPSYMIVDQGEGQTPRSFPDTFLSLAKSNKMRIPFVQGKYNAGGTGALRFCGRENYQLIASRRAPGLADASDPTKDLWGFTLVRRCRPTDGDNRRSSMYVYMVLNGQIPAFAANELLVLPGNSESKKAPEPYVRGIRYGTAIKLYSFKWRANGTATLEARFALNSALFRPILPVRVTEARKGYQANYFSTTVRGGAIDDNPQLDLGPLCGAIPLPDGRGTLPIEVRVFGEKDAAEEPGADGAPKDPSIEDPEKAGKKKRSKRRHSTGVIFTLNGQRHGELAANFITRRVGYEFLADDLLVVVDVTDMPADLREDIWMTSRDRVADTEEKQFIENAIEEFLKDHQGLRDLNNRRKQEWVTEQVDEDEPLDILQDMVSSDPALAEVFGVGGKLKRIVHGPTKIIAPFVGKPYPSYFRLKKPIAIKDCPINRSCRLEFETDVRDDYFSRGREKGTLTIVPPFMSAGFTLFQGACTVKLTLPFNAKVGELIDVTVDVTDPTQGDPFSTKLKIRVTAREESQPQENGKRPPKGQTENDGVDFPRIHEVRKEAWEGIGFNERSGVRFTGGTGGEKLEAWVNIDNLYLHNEKVRAKDEAERKLIDYYFKFGITILGLGLVHEAMLLGRRSGAGEDDEVQDQPKTKLTVREAYMEVNPILGGLASVVIPVVKRLSATASKAATTATKN
jgi:hypothetical protein